ncbi:glycogen debranching N-terminal domain-containing protein [Amnibacterium flavum]|uniref:Amylo-alpha-1,6-glucosidase n=1 Tax=Amnibacterium flavum TaxID=2173173 RepID=A0A2V1HUC8_9MICO|nr:glycogen debranching N-terminal domain-containing protein [Amnibacterium flavum]PVZ95292.1 amylo-alpha-1,6-glucosidase [Amnibacterium flavum]
MAGLQPLLDSATVVLAAPAQAWSDRSGELSGKGISGFYVGDRRVLSRMNATVDGSVPEIISTSAAADRAEFVSLLRTVDDASPDPRVRLRRNRVVGPDGLREEFTVESTLSTPVDLILAVTIEADFARMDSIKSGLGDDLPAALPTVDGATATWTHVGVTAALTAPDARLSATRTTLVVEWNVTVAPKSQATVALDVTARIDDAVVTAPASASPWEGVSVHADDVRLRRWVDAALRDLGSLRMSVADSDDVFLAAGAPWFFTLFGRDSIWAARMMLPFGTDLARDTLRVLAGMQGTHSDPQTAEQPGKIMHELRSSSLELPGEGIVLPPLYYGTVDATALWICLLSDAWRWGLDDAEIEPLIPHLEAALAWLSDFGDSDGDGFLEYIDESGRGLANQGWKDSGDSVQWNDGTLAKGPIALCEVQAYAYEAAIGGADLLDRFGRDGGDEWRQWAESLKKRFAEQFWVDADGGAYPAIALDADKRPVDSLTSNIGHLLGTGLLSAEQAGLVAHHLVSERLNSGYGLRTMATDAAGYWPLSYHGGSVWAHDTAIAILGLRREGYVAEAAELSEGLLRAAEGFGYRMPELHSGDAFGTVGAPVPYPAACRPQAWSAAAAVAVLAAAAGLEPDRDSGTLIVEPGDSPLARGVIVSGLAVGADRFTLDADAGRLSRE